MAYRQITARILVLMALVNLQVPGYACAANQSVGIPADGPQPPAAADERPPPAVKIGKIVRIELFEAQKFFPQSGEMGERTTQRIDRLEGTVRSISADSLTILDNFLSDRPLSIATADISSLKIRGQKQNHVGTGVMVGLFVGICLAATWKKGESEEESDSSSYRGLNISFDTKTARWILYPLGGAFIGLVLGKAISAEKWEEVPLGDPQSISDSNRQELSLGWSIEF